jgi:hypothetical protein
VAERESAFRRGVASIGGLLDPRLKFQAGVPSAPTDRLAAALRLVAEPLGLEVNEPAGEPAGVYSPLDEIARASGFGMRQVELRVSGDAVRLTASRQRFQLRHGCARRGGGWGTALCVQPAHLALALAVRGSELRCSRRHEDDRAREQVERSIFESVCTSLCPSSTQSINTLLFEIIVLCFL